MQISRNLRRAGAVAVLVASSGLVVAGELTVNGFLSVVGGKVLDGDGPRDAALDASYNCPCFISDYPFAGVYNEDVTFDPDTTFGVQFNYTITDKLSATAQLVAQGAQDYDVNIEWAYVSYALNDSWTLQGGRKRLPLFYYSDFFDVGYAYPWIRAPGDLYGWQIYGYEGLNALYSGSWGEFSVTGNLWIGRDEDTDNQTLGRLYYYTRVDETWKNMVGGYLDLSRDWFSMRFIYMQNEVDRVIWDGDIPEQRLQDEKQNFMGASFNIDYGNLIVRSEYNVFDRPDADNSYYASLLAVGYRLGDWTPMLSRSRFRETFLSDLDGMVGEEVDGEYHTTTSFTLRWDFTSSAALKIQYDKFEDDSVWQYDNDPDNLPGGVDSYYFIGDSTLLSIGIDVVF